MNMLNADFSAVELRLLTHIPNDIHITRAKELFGTDHPTPDQIRRAKLYNYDLMYSADPYQWW